jgi:hypothetical protein
MRSMHLLKKTLTVHMIFIIEFDSEKDIDYIQNFTAEIYSQLKRLKINYQHVSYSRLSTLFLKIGTIFR